MDNMVWQRFDNQEFSFDVEKETPVDLYLSLRHHTNYPYDHINVNVTIETPDGEKRSREYRFNLKDKKGSWKSSGMGELWDIDLPIRKNISFRDSGECRVIIENKMSKIHTPGILEVGLLVRKSE